MFLLAEKIMPDADKLQGEILCPEENLFQATMYSYENSYPIFPQQAYLDIKHTLLGDMPIKFTGKNFVHLSKSFKL